MNMLIIICCLLIFTPQATMKLSLFTIISFAFAAPLFADAASDEATSSPLLPEAFPNSRQDAAYPYPLLLADVAEEGLVAGNNAFDSASTNTIPPGGSCRNAKVCKNGSCRALDQCVSGYVCSNRKCIARSQRRWTDGDCRNEYDCGSGYFCSNGRCKSRQSRNVVPLIPPGGICDAYYGDECYSGYSCIGGVCALPLSPAGSIPEGGDCTNNRGDCMPGLLCSPSPLIGSDRWTCQ